MSRYRKGFGIADCGLKSRRKYCVLSLQEYECSGLGLRLSTFDFSVLLSSCSECPTCDFQSAIRDHI